jgi:hypothetical protein
MLSKLFLELTTSRAFTECRYAIRGDAPTWPKSACVPISASFIFLARAQWAIPFNTLRPIAYHPSPARLPGAPPRPTASPCRYGNAALSARALKGLREPTGLHKYRSGLILSATATSGHGDVHDYTLGASANVEAKLPVGAIAAGREREALSGLSADSIGSAGTRGTPSVPKGIGWTGVLVPPLVPIPRAALLENDGDR